MFLGETSAWARGECSGGKSGQKKEPSCQEPSRGGGGEERNAEGGAGISVRKGAQLGNQCGRNQEPKNRSITHLPHPLLQ